MLKTSIPVILVYMLIVVDRGSFFIWLGKMEHIDKKMYLFNETRQSTAPI